MYMTKVDLVALCRCDTLHAFDIKFKNLSWSYITGGKPRNYHEIVLT